MICVSFPKPQQTDIKNSTKSAREIAGELSVSYLLGGSIQRFENKVRIEIQLIDATTEQQIWAENYDRDLEDILKTQSEIAEKIALALKTNLSPEEKEVLRENTTNNAAAYDLYLKGKYEYNTYTRNGNIKATQYFRQAIAMDPNYSLAYAGLAGCYVTKSSIFGAEMNTPEAMKLAKPFIDKALALDPNLVEALLVKAFYLLYNNWDFKGAEQMYKKSIVSNHDQALALYADYLNFVTRFEEAHTIARRLNQTNPFYPNSRMILTLYYTGRFEEANEFGKTRLKLFHNYLTLDNYGFLMLNTGHYDEAIKLFQQALELEGIRYPRILGWMGAAYVRCGKTDKALEILKELKARSISTHNGSVNFFIAVIYAALDDKDSALNWLYEAYKNHEMEMPWLKSEPQFYSLNSDPRFQKLVTQVGFP